MDFDNKKAVGTQGCPRLGILRETPINPWADFSPKNKSKKNTAWIGCVSFALLLPNF
jgi:hypothetical protein